MKQLIFIFSIILFLCSNITAQERFNSVYYYPFGNASISMIENNSYYYVLSVTGEDYSNQYIGLFKIDNNGELVDYVTDGINDDYIFGGLNNLYYSNYHDNIYSCGDITNSTDYSHTLYISLTDTQLNSIQIVTIDADSFFTAYDITEVNDSLFALAIQRENPNNFAGLIIYDMNNDTVIKNVVYDIDGLETNGLFSKICNTFNNGFLLGGSTSAYGISPFKKDWLLIKTDSIGNKIWEQHYGNPVENDGRIMAMFESKDSTYIVAGGQAICNWSMNPISEAALRKIDTAGNLVWEKFYRRYDLDIDENLMRYSNMYISDIVEIENGNFAATLDYKRADGDGGAYRFRLFKFDSIGNILFSRTMSNTNIEYVQSLYSSSIKQTPDNGFIINGYGKYTWDYDPEQQFFLIKTDSLGCEGGVYLAPPPENVECPDFPETMYCNETYQSRLRVQGKSAPYTIEFSTGEIIENLYYPSVFIPKSQGTGSFTVHVGADTYNHSYDTATLYNPIPAEDMEPDIIELPLSVTIPENYFGPNLTATITNGYGESYEIILPVYVDCNVENNVIQTTQQLSVFPNPASDYLGIILLEYNDVCFVKVINSQGQVVFVDQLHSLESKINIEQLPEGNYIVRVYCGDKIENIKFTKI